MARTWTFESAVEFWFQHRHGDSDETWCDFASAEAFILDFLPQSSSDADQIFEVLLGQGPGSRCDGRDILALTHLQTYVRALHQSASMAA